MEAVIVAQLCEPLHFVPEAPHCSGHVYLSQPSALWGLSATLGRHQKSNSSELGCIVLVAQSLIIIYWMVTWFSTTDNSWSLSMMKLSNFSVLPLAFTLSAGSLPCFWNDSRSDSWQLPSFFCPLAKYSLCSFTWCFFKCLIALMVLYVARKLPPLWITVLQTLHFAVLLCGVSSVKYFHTADTLASHSAVQC